jgi:hypothetical protein
VEKLESVREGGFLGEGIPGGGGLLGVREIHGVPVDGLAMLMQAVCSGIALALLTGCNAGLVDLVGSDGIAVEDALVVLAHFLIVVDLLGVADAEGFEDLGVAVGFLTGGVDEGAAVRGGDALLQGAVAEVAVIGIEQEEAAG